MAYACARVQDDSESALIDAVRKELEVSPKAAAELLKDYWNLFHVQQLGDDVFSISGGGDPAKAYDRSMRQTLLFQLMEEVLTPRELNLVRCYLGIGQSNEQGMTFQELAIRLNYNGPSGAEKAYKSAIRKLRKELYASAYGQWLSIQKAIQAARRETCKVKEYSSLQTTWPDEQKLVYGFLCKTVVLSDVYCVLHEAREPNRP